MSKGLRLLSIPLPTAGALAALLIASPAEAQRFGRRGDLSFGADRLMGLYIGNRDGGDRLSLGLGGAVPGSHPYLTPRLGIDYLVIDHLSVGGSFALWYVDGRHGNDDEFGVLLYPRVGGVFNFGDHFGIWPRGGFTFRSFYDDEFALTAELPFFATPTDHFGFTFGPTVDVGLAGDGGEAFVFGIAAAGVFGWI